MIEPTTNNIHRAISQDDHSNHHWAAAVHITTSTTSRYQCDAIAESTTKIQRNSKLDQRGFQHEALNLEKKTRNDLGQI